MYTCLAVVHYELYAVSQRMLKTPVCCAAYWTQWGARVVRRALHWQGCLLLLVPVERAGPCCYE